MIDQIEWTGAAPDVLIDSFPVEERKFKFGAKLTLMEAQAAVFFSEGRPADVFFPGRYILSLGNLQEMRKARSWPPGYSGSFEADLFFVHTGVMQGVRWSTLNPIKLCHDKLGEVKLWAEGSFSFRIASPFKLLEHISGTNQIYETEYLKGHLRSLILLGLSDFLNQHAAQIAARLTAPETWADRAADGIEALLRPMGLELVSFILERIDLPEELEMLLARSALHEEDEAEPEREQTPAEADPAAETAERAAAEICCASCGSELEPEYRFCPACGAEHPAEQPNCAGCGFELAPTMNFCPRCGEKRGAYGLTPK